MNQMAVQVSVLTSSGNEHSKSSRPLEEEIELKSFTDVAIDERRESKAKEYSRSLPTLDNDIELDSFTDVAIDEKTESKATKSKFKTEVEENYPLTNFQLFLLII